jgi:hypothetical protein
MEGLYGGIRAGHEKYVNGECANGEWDMMGTFIAKE